MIRFSFSKKIIKSYTQNNNNFFTKIILPKCYSKIEIGNYSFVNDEIEVLSFRQPNKVIIGKYCSIGKCQIYCGDGDHNLNYATTYPFKELGFSELSPENKNIKTPPIIGNDVWICDDAKILAGITINNGIVIASNTVVTKTFPPYAVLAGNPAKVVKYRFSPDIIKRLEEVQWWNFDHFFICEKLAPIIDNIEEFLRVAEEYKNSI